MHIDNARPDHVAASAVEPAYWRKSGSPFDRVIERETIGHPTLPVQDQGLQAGRYVPLSRLVQE